MLTINTVKMVNGVILQVCEICHKVIFENEQSTVYSINLGPYNVHQSCYAEEQMEMLMEDAPMEEPLITNEE